jgi:holo-[acyl-carrier protein] synthase
MSSTDSPISPFGSRAAIRHGIDLVHVPTLREKLQDNPSLAAGLFTAGERDYCGLRSDPWPHLAARFAAKEATLKALRRGLSTDGPDRALHEIEVVRDHGAPRLALSGGVRRLADRLGLGDPVLSLSHAGEMAIASVIWQPWREWQEDVLAPAVAPTPSEPRP